MKYPKPFYRTQRNGYVVQIGKTQKLLAKGPQSPEVEAEAYKAYHRLMAAEGITAPPTDYAIQHVVELFLDDVQARVEQSSFDQYRIKLQAFVARHGRMKASSLRAHHVSAWVKSQDWSTSTARNAITSLKVCFAWLARGGYVAADPLKDMKRPKGARRERTLTAEERGIIQDAANPQLADYLNALTWSGCRPGEIMRLEAKHIDFDAGYAALPGKTTKATGLLIEFPLIPEMLELCARLAKLHPVGPIFRNTRGKPWSPNSVRCSMRRLRAREGLDGVVAYTFRHSFATDALERGIPVTDVAALMNHRDIKTTMNYNHIQKRREHLKQQARKAQKEPQG